jgi:hypothetical protein
MKHGWLYIIGLVLLATILFGATPALAASAAGPYYANPSWDQTLPASTRFIVLTNMNSEAVLDRETGLVWEQSPTNFIPLYIAPPGTPPNTITHWYYAGIACADLTKGGRDGWRLPTIQELKSLVDRTQTPVLPSGHPFSDVQSGVYWSATSWATSTSYAYDVDFSDGSSHWESKGTPHYFWCVRGGQGSDPQ